MAKVKVADGYVDLYTSAERYEFEEEGSIDGGRFTSFHIRQYTDAELAAGTGAGSVVTSDPMIRPNWTNKGSHGQGSWEQCSICLQAFPLAKLAKIHGKYYCFKYKHYLDAD